MPLRQRGAPSSPYDSLPPSTAIELNGVSRSIGSSEQAERHASVNRPAVACIEQCLAGIRRIVRDDVARGDVRLVENIIQLQIEPRKTNIGIVCDGDQLA